MFKADPTGTSSQLIGERAFLVDNTTVISKVLPPEVSIDLTHPKSGRNEEKTHLTFVFKELPLARRRYQQAWCFFTMKELNVEKETQDMALEIYAKPTDLKCKKLSLLSVKQLYLHLECMIRTE